MKKVLILAVLSLVVGWCCLANAAPVTCLFTGSLSDIYGTAGAPYRVTYKGIATQNAGSEIIPGGSMCSVKTDNSGNLPSSGACTSFVQGAVMLVTVGKGQPVQIQVPVQASADLSTLILANSDPPSIVSQISISTGGDYVLTVTNPSAGTVGQAILGPGNVTGWAGQKIPTSVPTSGAMPVYTATAGGQWSFPQFAYAGTFQPLIWAGSTATPTLTYWIQDGNYTVVGNTVTVWYRVNWTWVSGTVTAPNVICLSLPSAVPTPLGTPGTTLYPQGALSYSNITLDAGFTGMGANVNNFSLSSCPVVVIEMGSGHATGNATFSIATAAATVGLSGQVSYRWY